MLFLFNFENIIELHKYPGGIRNFSNWNEACLSKITDNFI